MFRVPPQDLSKEDSSFILICKEKGRYEKGKKTWGNPPEPLERGQRDASARN